MTAGSDVEIPSRDWVALRGKKLFWVPEIIAAYTDTVSPISQAELESQSPQNAARNKKYSIASVREVCQGQPVTFVKALAICEGFDRLVGREATYIVSAVFLLERYAELFSASAFKAHGVEVTAQMLGLRQPTLDNVLDGGRITAHVAKTFLEGAQAAYKAVFAASSAPTAEISDFIACADLKDYVTTSKDAGHQEVRKDSSGDYLCASEDLLPAPAGWTDWT